MVRSPEGGKVLEFEIVGFSMVGRGLGKCPMIWTEQHSVFR